MKRPHSRQAPHRSPPFWTLHLCKIVLAERIGQCHDIEDDGDDCVSHEYGVLQFPIAVEQQRHKHNSEDALRNVAKDEGADSDEQGDDCHEQEAVWYTAGTCDWEGLLEFRRVHDTFKVNFQFEDFRVRSKPNTFDSVWRV
jgi:hypothetical protein